MEKELLILLRQFIAFRSVAGKPDVKKQCLGWIQQTFLSKSPLKLHHGEVEGSPYIYLEHPKPKLLWFAHTDVVPADEAMFEVKINGDKALGRGVKDMKGAALTFLLAFRDALADGEKPPVSILLTSDEEIGGHSIPALLSRGLCKAPVAFTPDTGANPTIVVEHKGAVWSRLEATGKGSHGAWPWEGKNPVQMLAHAIDILAKEFPPGKSDEWRVTVSPTEIHGSDARNKIPDTAACTLDIRFPPSICPTEDDAVALVRKHLPKGCTITPLVIAGPLKTDRKHPMVQQYKKIAEKICGTQLHMGMEHGASDARFFQDFGIPAFLHGPVGGDLHNTDEWVSVKSLVHHYEISRAWMKEL